MKGLCDALVEMEGQGKAMGDITSLVGSLTDGPFRERLLALLVQESPYPGELVDRLMADTIRKIRERSSKEMDKVLTRRIAEAEKANDMTLRDSLIVQKQRLRRADKGPA